MRFKGTLKSWNDERGFGFIESEQGGQEILVHVKAIPHLKGRPALNLPLSFEVELGLNGKKRAKLVEVIRPARAARTHRNDSPAHWGAATLFAITAFIFLFAVLAFWWRIPLVYAAVYLAASLVTFIAYAVDKSAAQSNRWRTPESTLHVLAIVCGWPGALLAQQFLRHKSSKRKFRAVFWVTVVINVVAFIFACSPAGKALLQFS
jgi:uncharacterized membrane protein YsdA (DUF1294 family)/cold shock CspA family protein